MPKRSTLHKGKGFIATYQKGPIDTIPLSSANKINPKKVFHHNPLHDFESLWWICVEKLFKHQVVLTIVEENGEVKNVELVKKDQFMQQWKVASEIFSSAILNRKRLNFLKDDAVFYECTSTLSPELVGVLDILGQIRQQLVACYVVAEADYPNISQDAFEIRHLTFLSDLFSAAIKAAEGFALKDFPKEWIEEFYEPVLPNAGQSNTTSRSSAKRGLDDPFNEGRISKQQK